MDRGETIRFTLTVFMGPRHYTKDQSSLHQNNSAWAGTIFKTDSTSIIKLVSQEKWDKTKRLLEELLLEFTRQETGMIRLDFKRLEQILGYPCHISMTYERVNLFLKGFHLTLCKYLPNRNQAGWKISEVAYTSYIQTIYSENMINDKT